MTARRPVTAWRVLGGVAAVAGCLFYAVLAHRAASAPSPGLFEAAVFIVPLLAFALVLAWRSTRRVLLVGLWLATCVGLFLARDRLAAGTQWVLLAQHVGFNLMLCLLFGRTLAPASVPLVSRLAEIVHGTLSPLLQRYTRRVTWAWVCYFGLTALVSLGLFAFAPVPAWSAFVNLLSLPLLGAMFAAEYLVRCIVIPRSERSSFLSSMAAWRQFSRSDSGKPL